MSRSDKWLSVIVLGLIAPVSLMLLFWWGSIPLVKENITIAYLALAGFAIGIALDCTVLRKFTARLFCLPIPALFAVAFFYSILFFGFFMGFPVFNVLIGISCAYVTARSCVLSGESRENIRKKARAVHLFSLILLFSICICTAVLSLREASIGLQVQHMLALPFKVTPVMIWAIILVGGTALLTFQYGMSRWIFHKLEKKALPVLQE